MKCPDTGTWQAYLDGEVTEQERLLLHEHSQNCQQCTAALNELNHLESWSNSRLSTYGAATDRMAAAQTSLSTDETKNNKAGTNLKGAIWMRRGLRKWAAVAASIVMLTTALTITPVQQAVANFLSIFRVQQIEVVQLNPGDMQQMANAIESKVGEVDLQQFGKVEIKQKPEQKRLPLDNISSEVPFDFKLPAFTPAGFMPEQAASIITGGKSEFQFNVEQVNSLLKSLGSSTLLPESLEGKTFSISTPAIVQVKYLAPDGQRSFSYSQFESPEIIAPSGVDPNALRAALLDLPILPDDLRTQLAGIEDWQHTLILPSVQGTEELMINGKKAIFARSNGDLTSLLWLDDGVIYQLRGSLDRAEALEIANSLYNSNQ